MKAFKYYWVTAIMGLVLLWMGMPAFAADPISYANTGVRFAVTNIINPVTNAHTSGYVWDYMTNSDVLRSSDSYATLRSLKVVAQTNAPLNFFFFSRPVTAPTRNAVWALTPADARYALGAPIVISAGDYTAAGTNYIGGTNGIVLPLHNTWTNTSIYCVITVSGTISNSTVCTNHIIQLLGDRVY